MEHVDNSKYEKVYGVDINPSYLKKTEERYAYLSDVLECLCIDLITEANRLPKADLLVANLLIEYIGYDAFKKVIVQWKKTGSARLFRTVMLGITSESRAGIV